MRLPTICVRPGAPNAAASSFVSGIIREPLHGEEAVRPVGRDLEFLRLSSSRTAVANLVHGALNLGPEALGLRRIVNLPGITVTVNGMIAALEKVAGPEVASRIVFEEVPCREAHRVQLAVPVRRQPGDVARLRRSRTLSR